MVLRAVRAAAPPAGTNVAPRLQIERLTKRFGGVVAVDDVSLAVAAGEVHALLGENGAGKTTLMRVVFGIHRPDRGQILLDGRGVDITSPKAAIAHDIAMVHQHSTLVGPLTVAQNFALAENTPVGLDLKRVAERIKDLGERYDLVVDARTTVRNLDVGTQQRVEILRALYGGARLLILDEPTAALSLPESEQLFEVMRELAAEGTSVVFISHKLREVFGVSDRITVLRHGRVAATLDTRDADPALVTRLMVGGDVCVQARPPAKHDETASLAIVVKRLAAKDDQGQLALTDSSFTVESGEIFCIAGVEGNGQRELAETLVGLRRPASGRADILGTDVSRLSPRAVTALGVAFVPEDRHDGLVLDLSVRENLVLHQDDRARFRRRWMLDQRALHEHSESIISRFGVMGAAPGTVARHLSGGNQQKLILGRELHRGPRVLIASQATRGLDVGATAHIHRLLRERRAEGTAILYISSDLDEILELADRVGVMAHRRIVAVLERAKTTREEVGFLMAGVEEPAMTARTA